MVVEGRVEHLQLLLHQVATQLQSGRQGSRDCTLQCSDGTHYTSSLLLASLSPSLARLMGEVTGGGLGEGVGEEVRDLVIVLPGLQLGELLLFWKYLLCPRVAAMFSKEDTRVLDRVCEELLVDFQSLGRNPVSRKEDCQPYRPEGSLVDTEIEICPEEEHERVIPHDEAMETEGANIEEASKTENEHKELMVIQVAEAGQKEEVSPAMEKMMRDRRAETQEKLQSMVKCRWCDQQVRFPLVGKHQRQHHPEQEHTCLACGEEHCSRAELCSHLVEHKEPGPAYLACDRCGRVCLSQYQLQQHKKTHNSKQLGSMTCPECQKTFQMAHKFREHLAAHETGTLGRNFPCVHCAKTFRKQYDLARHLKSHLGIKSHKCDECGETFVDGTRLKQHRWIHLQHRAYRCSAPGCKEAFRHKAHLKSHTASFHPEVMDAMGEKRFDCHLCNRRFAFPYALRTHLEWHQLEEKDLARGRVEEVVVGEEGVYECAICGEQFPGINLLGQHCQVHMEEHQEGGGGVQEHMENHEGGVRVQEHRENHEEGGVRVQEHIEEGVREQKETNKQLDSNVLKSL